MTHGTDSLHDSLMHEFKVAMHEEARLDPRFAPASHDQMTRYANAHHRVERIRQQIRALPSGEIRA